MDAAGKQPPSQTRHQRIRVKKRRGQAGLGLEPAPTPRAPEKQRLPPHLLQLPLQLQQLPILGAAGLPPQPHDAVQAAQCIPGCSCVPPRQGER